jgi:hypothetical protein
MTTGKSGFGILGAIWGIIGLTFIFCGAIYRLSPHAAELSKSTLNGGQWGLLLLGLLLAAYIKGYRIFHQRFAPRFAARARYLTEHPTAMRVLFAPFFCMGYFYATRKRKLISYGISTMIVALIIGVRTLEQPWRGIIDASVILGLGWGLISIWIFSFKTFFGNPADVSPEIPT